MVAMQVQQAREVAKSEHAKAQNAMARLSENGAWPVPDIKPAAMDMEMHATCKPHLHVARLAAFGPCSLLGQDRSCAMGKE